MTKQHSPEPPIDTPRIVYKLVIIALDSVLSSEPDTPHTSPVGRLVGSIEGDSVGRIEGLVGVEVGVSEGTLVGVVDGRVVGVLLGVVDG